MGEPTSRVAVREIAAPAGRIFALLAQPDEHRRFDESAMVGRAVTPTRLTDVGEVFTMEMTYTHADYTEHYRTDNHVTDFEEGRSVQWAVAPHGGQLLGWYWRYELEPLEDDPDRTRVRLIYDWSDTPAQTRRRFNVSRFRDGDLDASLARLATATGGE